MATASKQSDSKAKIEGGREYDPPAIDWESRAYWEGAGRGELVLQRCRACDVVQHRPRGFCVSCMEDQLEHFVASGRGTVYTYSIVHQNQMPKFRNALPYVVAYVELEEGPQLLTNIVDCDPETISIGMPVYVEFKATPNEKTGDQLGVPRFRPA
ncbi:MAG: Zn-ribbon domain-containing OB-fold protein [Myxococcales bacterium]|jgi:uncharacterized OB-fold protein|nr:Zn-ribbon domain-containing OB-fold protein [Myxococcales bacterium]HIK86585.1 Zn-ribbon domain-containing OB-fold protein [Myxococcales bacterium]